MLWSAYKVVWLSQGAPCYSMYVKRMYFHRALFPLRQLLYHLLATHLLPFHHSSSSSSNDKNTECAQIVCACALCAHSLANVNWSIKQNSDSMPKAKGSLRMTMYSIVLLCKAKRQVCLSLSPSFSDSLALSLYVF